MLTLKREQPLTNSTASQRDSTTQCLRCWLFFRFELQKSRSTSHWQHAGPGGGGGPRTTANAMPPATLRNKWVRLKVAIPSDSKSPTSSPICILSTSCDLWMSSLTHARPARPCPHSPQCTANVAVSVTCSVAWSSRNAPDSAIRRSNHAACI